MTKKSAHSEHQVFGSTTHPVQIQDTLLTATQFVSARRLNLKIRPYKNTYIYVACRLNIMQRWLDSWAPLNVAASGDSESQPTEINQGSRPVALPTFNVTMDAI